MSNHHSPDSYAEVQRIFADALDLFARKNADYGDAWRRNGWRGNLSRIFEKADRVRHLVWRADPRVPAVGDEAAVQTLKDMLNTIAFAIINLEEEVEFGHETPRSERYGETPSGPSPLEQYYQEHGMAPAHRTVREAYLAGGGVLPPDTPQGANYDSVASAYGQTAYENSGGTLPPLVAQTVVIPAEELNPTPIPVGDDTNH